MQNRLGEWIIGIVFSLIGGVFLTIGIIMFINDNNFKKTAIEHTAVITRIEKEGFGDDATHRVYILYEVNGQSYNEQIGSYSSSWRVGKELKIYYNPENPRDIREAGIGLVFLLAFGLFGGIFFLIGSAFIISILRKIIIKTRLKNNGFYIMAEITDIALNHSYSVNRRNPYYINCQWQNPSDGQIYLFKSDNIWFDPTSIINERGITALRVYLNQNKPKEYWMALDEIEGNIVDLR